MRVCHLATTLWCLHASCKGSTASGSEKCGTLDRNLHASTPISSSLWQPHLTVAAAACQSKVAGLRGQERGICWRSGVLRVAGGGRENLPGLSEQNRWKPHGCSVDRALAWDTFLIHIRTQQEKPNFRRPCCIIVFKSNIVTRIVNCHICFKWGLDVVNPSSSIPSPKPKIYTAAICTSWM